MADGRWRMVKPFSQPESLLISVTMGTIRPPITEKTPRRTMTTERTAITVPANMAWPFARASNISPAMCKISARVLLRGPAKQARQPRRKFRPGRHGLGKSSALLDLAGHELAGPVQIGILDPFAGQPQGL